MALHRDGLCDVRPRSSTEAAEVTVTAALCTKKNAKEGKRYSEKVRLWSWPGRTTVPAHTHTSTVIRESCSSFLAHKRHSSSRAQEWFKPLRMNEEDDDPFPVLRVGKVPGKWPMSLESLESLVVS
uniref:Uncharacterized protein n=1 Tax=Knipowitschia caucasica TaxID=637954 RepID=A0AAV2IXN4_KNICA